MSSKEYTNTRRRPLELQSNLELQFFSTSTRRTATTIQLAIMSFDISFRGTFPANMTAQGSDGSKELSFSGTSSRLRLTGSSGLSWMFQTSRNYRSSISSCTMPTILRFVENMFMVHSGRGLILYRIGVLYAAWLRP